MQGKGKLVLANQTTYTGDFFENKLHGKGKYEWPDGSVYEGEVTNGLRNGRGKFISPGYEAVYEGECNIVFLKQISLSPQLLGCPSKGRLARSRNATF